MKTTNIISTPNIEGNIGSCTIQSNEITTGSTFWTRQETVTQVNSCTGKVVSQNTYTDYGGLQFFAGLGLLVLVVVAIIGFIAFVDSY